MRNRPFILLVFLCFVFSTGVSAIGHCKHTLIEALVADDTGDCEDGDCDTIEATISASVNVNKTQQALNQTRVAKTNTTYRKIQQSHLFRNHISINPGQVHSNPLYLINRSFII